jgi:hypothetical protein
MSHRPSRSGQNGFDYAPHQHRSTLRPAGVPPRRGMRPACDRTGQCVSRPAWVLSSLCARRLRRAVSRPLGADRVTRTDDQGIRVVIGPNGSRLRDNHQPHQLLRTGFDNRFARQAANGTGALPPPRGNRRVNSETRRPTARFAALSFPRGRTRAARPSGRRYGYRAASGSGSRPAVGTGAKLSGCQSAADRVRVKKARVQRHVGGHNGVREQVPPRVRRSGGRQSFAGGSHLEISLERLARPLFSVSEENRLSPVPSEEDRATAKKGGAGGTAAGRGQAGSSPTRGRGTHRSSKSAVLRDSHVWP